MIYGHETILRQCDNITTVVSNLTIIITMNELWILTKTLMAVLLEYLGHCITWRQKNHRVPVCTRYHWETIAVVLGCAPKTGLACYSSRLICIDNFTLLSMGSESDGITGSSRWFVIEMIPSAWHLTGLNLNWIELIILIQSMHVSYHVTNEDVYQDLPRLNEMRGRRLQFPGHCQRWSHELVSKMLLSCSLD